MSFNSVPLDLNHFLSFMCLLDFLWVPYRGCKESIKKIDQPISNKLFDGHYGDNVLSILVSIWCQGNVLEAFHLFEKT